MYSPTWTRWMTPPGSLIRTSICGPTPTEPTILRLSSANISSGSLARLASGRGPLLALQFGRTRAERVTPVLIVVLERLEGLDHGQRRNRRAFPGLLLGYPCAQVRHAAGASCEYQRRCQHQRQARQLGGFAGNRRVHHFFAPALFLLAAALSSSS